MRVICLDCGAASGQPHSIECPRYKEPEGSEAMATKCYVSAADYKTHFAGAKKTRPAKK